MTTRRFIAVWAALIVACVAFWVALGVLAAKALS